MTTRTQTATKLAASIAAIVLTFTGTAEAAISVVNQSGEAKPGGDYATNPYTVQFNAGATADKLIIAISSEGGGANGGPTISYNGVPLTRVSGTAADRLLGFWYLDAPYTGGNADLVLDFTQSSTVNGMGYGVVSISGSAPGVAVSNVVSASTSVTITPAVAGSFVMAAYGQNGSATGDPAAPLTELYSGNIGSASGGAGYENGVGASLQTYSFTGSGGGVGAVAFSPGPATVAAGYDFCVDAGQDTDGDSHWEDLTAGNPSGLGLLLDSSPAVNRVAVSTSTKLTHAYDFPGGSTGEQVAGAALVSTGGGASNDKSFDDALGPVTGWDTKAVTFEIWFRPDNLTPTPSNGQIIFEDGGGTGLGFFVDNNELVCGQDSNNPLIAYNINTDPSGLLLGPATSEFIQLVMTRTAGGATTFYVNGSNVVGTASDDGDWSGGDPAAFGTRGGSNVGGRGGNQASTESFDGEIALVRVYADQVLNQYQVQDNFEALTGPDTNAPAISALSPADDETDVLVDTDLVATFDEDIALSGAGTIVVTNLDDNTGLTIDLSGALPDGGGNNVTVSGTDLTIALGSDLGAGTNYAVRISTNAVADAATNYFAGITNNTTWNFTTAPPDSTPPTLNSSAIVDLMDGVPASQNIAAHYTLTFSEPIDISSLETGLSNVAAGGPGITVGTIVENGNQYTVPVTPTGTGDLQLQVADTVTDVAGNPLASAVSDEDTLTVDSKIYYVWTGAIDTDLTDAGNWLLGGAVPAAAPASASANQPETPNIDGVIWFDSLHPGYVSGMGQLYFRTPNWGSFVVRNGTVQGRGDNNSTANSSWSGTDTMVVGDGTGAAAVMNSELRNLNSSGTGTKTYIVNSDGTLRNGQSATSVLTWSANSSVDTVMRLIGGASIIDGYITESPMTGDAGDYVTFEAEGSTFTAGFGGSGQFQNIAAVRAHLGAGLSFRGVNGNNITAADNGNGTFTISVDNDAPTLAVSDIVDNQGGGPVDENLPITYTLTFSEELDVSTLDADAFANAAGATPYALGAITQVDALNYTVVITPTAAGSFQLRVTTDVTDLAGNALAANVDDAQVITVNANTDPPTADLNGGASDIGIGTATLNGSMPVGAVGQAYICWGSSDGGTGSTGLWENVVSMGTVSAGDTFAEALAGLYFGIEYNYRVYATNDYGSDWSDLDTFTTLAPVPYSPAIAIYTEATAGEAVTTANLDHDFDTDVRTDPIVTKSGSDLTLNQSGHYLVMYNARFDTTGGSNQSEIQSLLRLAGADLPIGWSQCYHRRATDSYAGICAGGGIINANASDVLVLSSYRTDSNSGAGVQREPNGTGIQILKLDDNWDYCRLSQSVGLSGIGDTSTFEPVTYDTQDELDTDSFGHTADSGNITLKSAGHYLVFANTHFVMGGSARASYQQMLALGGSEVAGTRTTVYLRGGGVDSCGDGATALGTVIETTAANTVLTVQVAQEQNTGDNPTIAGGKTAITIVKLPDTGDYVRLGYSGSPNQTMAPASTTGFTWDQTHEVDAAAFSHSGADITVGSNDDYLFLSALYCNDDGASTARTVYQQLYRVNAGTPSAYGQGARYFRDNDVDSGGNWAGAILGLSANDDVQVAVKNIHQAAERALYATANRTGVQAVRLGAFASAPSGITNNSAQNIFETAADLTGTLTAPQSVFTVTAYVSSNNNLSAAAWTNDATVLTFAVGTFTNVSDQAISVTASNLVADTGYYYTMVASNAVTNIWAAPNASFTTDAAVLDPPVAELDGGVANIGIGEATLRGVVSSGAVSEAYICWGTTDGGTASTGNWQNVISVGSVFATVSFSNTLSSLLYGLEYSYRVYATNAYGDDWSAVDTFTTAPPEGDWSPAELTSAILWLDADDASTITEATGVSQWDDKSGNGNDVVQATGASQPVSGSTTIGGRNAILFDGTDDLLQTASNPFGANVSDAFVAVLLDIKTTANSTLFSLTADSTDRWQAHSPWGSGTVYFDCGGTASPNRINYGSGWAANKQVLMGFYCSVTDSKQEVWESGALKVSDATGHSVPTTAGIAVGGFDGNYDDCAIGEMIVIDGTVTTEDRQKMEGYLSHKWGVDADLPGGHPYKTEAPPGGDSIAVANTAATNVLANSADLLGALDATQSVFDVYVYWSTTDHADAAAWLADGTASNAFIGSYTNVTGQPLSESVSGLSGGTTYYYTMMATNAATNIWASPNASFTPPAPPTVTTAGGATDIGGRAATLNAELTAGVTADAWFCWDTTDKGTSGTGVWANVVSVGSQAQGVPFSTGISGLDLDTSYSYRVYVSNVAGSDWSGVDTFTTLATPTYTWTQGGADPTVWTDTANWDAEGVPPQSVAGTRLVFSPSTSGQIGTSGNKVTFGQLTISSSFDWRSFGSYGSQNTTGIFVDSGTSTPATVTLSGGAVMGAYYTPWNLDTDLELFGNGAITFHGYAQEGVNGPGGVIINSGTRVECGGTHGSEEWTYSGGVTVRNGGIFDVSHSNGQLGDGLVTIEEGGQVQALGGTFDQDVSIVLGTDGANPAVNTVLITSTPNFTGQFSFDVSGVSPADGNEWQIVNAGATYGGGFSVDGFWDLGGGLWNGLLDGRRYQFDTSTGKLTAYDLHLAITNTAAANIGENSADLGGEVDVGGDSADVIVYYSTTDNADADAWLADVSAASETVGTFNNVAGHSVTGAVSSLGPGTTYYYTMVVSNALEGAVWASPNKSFTTTLTLEDPVVTTGGGATGLGFGTATLRGLLTAGGTADALICWGTSDGGTSTGSWDSVLSMGSVTEMIPFTTNLTGLIYGIEYNYRVYATNGASNAWSSVASFTTEAPGSDPLGISYYPITNDGDSDISSTKTYTHALDFGTADSGGGGTATINGVVFATAGTGNFPAIGGSSQTVGTGSHSHGRANHAGNGNANVPGGSGMEALLWGMAWNDTTLTMTLTGLTPEQPYRFRLYNRQWGATAGGRGQDFGFDTDGVGAGIGGAEYTGHFEADDASDPDPSMGAFDQVYGLTCDYTLSPGVDTLTVYVDATTAGTYHMYGLTNEEMPPRIADLVLANTSAASVTETTADLQGTLDATQSVFTVTAYYSQNNNADGAAWLADGTATSVPVGSFTNVLGQPLSVPVAGLTGGVTYYYTFLASNAATNMWASPNASFTTLSTPVVTDAGGASPVGASVATLNGQLTGGGNADVYFCWDTADQGTGGTGAWANVVSMGEVLQGESVSNQITGLSLDTSYAYRCYATNPAGDSWSDVDTFTTLATATYTWIQGGDQTDWVDPLNWDFEGVPPSDVPGTVIHFGPATSGSIGENYNGKVTVGSVSWETGFSLRSLGNYSDASTGLIIDSGSSGPATFTFSNGAFMDQYYVPITLNSDLLLSGTGSGGGFEVHAANGKVTGTGGFIVESGTLKFKKTHQGTDHPYTGGVTIRGVGVVQVVDGSNEALGEGLVTIEEGGQLRPLSSTLDNNVSFVLTSDGADPAANSVLITASPTFTGQFSFDLSGVSPSAGNQWQIVNASATYGAGFSVAGFSDRGDAWEGTVNGIRCIFYKNLGILQVKPYGGIFLLR